MNIMLNFGFLVFGIRLGKRLAEWVALYIDGRTDLHPLKGLYQRNPWVDARCIC